MQADNFGQGGRRLGYFADESAVDHEISSRKVLQKMASKNRGGVLPSRQRNAISSTNKKAGKATQERQQRPRCAAFAEKGVSTASQFAGMMSALISDVIEGRVTPGVCNAAVNAGGKLLKVVDMQQRYGRFDGTSEDAGSVKELILFKTESVA